VLENMDITGSILDEYSHGSSFDVMADAIRHVGETV
jgi:hypothetical protein